MRASSPFGVLRCHIHLNVLDMTSKGSTPLKIPGRYSCIAPPGQIDAITIHDYLSVVVATYAPRVYAVHTGWEHSYVGSSKPGSTSQLSGRQRRAISDATLFLFPIHVRKTHWVACAVDTECCAVYYYDSRNLDEFRLARSYTVVSVVSPSRSAR